LIHNCGLIVVIALARGLIGRAFVSSVLAKLILRSTTWTLRVPRPATYRKLRVVNGRRRRFDSAQFAGVTYRRAAGRSDPPPDTGDILYR